ncbi:hypothetical protein ACWD69_31590 [Micromonospora chokoriensis]
MPEAPAFGAREPGALQALFDHARLAPWWRARLPTGLEAWEALSATMPIRSDDLRRHGRPGPSSMLTGLPTAAFVFSSGGSRGEPRLTYRNFEEFDNYGRYFDGLEIGPGDVVANLFGAGIWGSFTAHNIGLRQRSCVIVPLGSDGLLPDALEGTLSILRATNVNTLAASSSAIIAAGRLFPLDVRERIQKVYCTGERRDSAEILSGL